MSLTCCALLALSATLASASSLQIQSSLSDPRPSPVLAFDLDAQTRVVVDTKIADGLRFPDESYRSSSGLEVIFQRGRIVALAKSGIKARVESVSIERGRMILHGADLAKVSLAGQDPVLPNGLYVSQRPGSQPDDPEPKPQPDEPEPIPQGPRLHGFEVKGGEMVNVIIGG